MDIEANNRCKEAGRLYATMTIAGFIGYPDTCWRWVGPVSTNISYGKVSKIITVIQRVLFISITDFDIKTGFIRRKCGSPV